MLVGCFCTLWCMCGSVSLFICHYLSGTLSLPEPPNEQPRIYRYPRSPEAESKVVPSSETEPTAKTKEEPGTEPEKEAKVEPGASVEPEPKSKSEAKSETSPVSELPNSSSEPEVSPETWPEAGPRWMEAFKTWSWSWELHIYLFATLFLLIGLYAGYYVMANVYDGLTGKFLSVSLNGMVVLFGLTRAVVMYIDPYHQGGHINVMLLMRVLWSIGGPCLTAADSAIILALVELAKINIAPPRLQKLSTVSIIVVMHFVFVVFTDWIVSNYVEAKAMLLFCQVFYIVWGSLLGTGYIRLGIVLDRKLFSHKRVKDKEDKTYLALIYISGAANYFLCCIVLYSACGVFGVYSDVEFVGAWEWWILQTLFRFSEVITCVLIFTVSAKRNRVKDRADEEVNPVAPAPTPAWVQTAGESTKNVRSQRCFADESVQRTEQIQGTKIRQSFIRTLAKHLQKNNVRRVSLNTKNEDREFTCSARASAGSNRTEDNTSSHQASVGFLFSTQNVPKIRANEVPDKHFHDDSSQSKVHSRTPVTLEGSIDNRAEWHKRVGNLTVDEPWLDNTRFPYQSGKPTPQKRSGTRSGRRCSVFSALQNAKIEIELQKRDIERANEAIADVNRAFSVLDEVGEVNQGFSQTGPIPERDRRNRDAEKVVSEINRPEEDEIEIRPLVTRRNSMFSALEEAKVESIQYRYHEEGCSPEVDGALQTAALQKPSLLSRLSHELLGKVKSNTLYSEGNDICTENSKNHEVTTTTTQIEIDKSVGVVL